MTLEFGKNSWTPLIELGIQLLLTAEEHSQLTIQLQNLEFGKNSLTLEFGKNSLTPLIKLGIQLLLTAEEHTQLTIQLHLLGLKD